MNRTVAVKIVCIAAVLIFAYFVLQAFVLPKADALNARSFDSPVKIDDSTFPDSAFREYVSENIDANNDGYLTPQERDAVTEIANPGLSGKGVSDVTGIEYFSYLETLDLSNNSLNDVNLSRNTKLTSLDLRGNRHSDGAEFSFSLADDLEGEITVYVSSDSSIEGKTSKVKIVKAD